MRGIGDTLLALALVFAPLSLVSFGGGNAVLAAIAQQSVAVHHWTGAHEFADLFALSRAAPGPGSMLAALIGWKAAGIAGAAVATLAFYVPSVLLVCVVGRLWAVWRGAAWHGAIERGLAPVAGGLFLAGGIAVLRISPGGWPQWAAAFAVTAVLLRWPRLHPVPLLLVTRQRRTSASWRCWISRRPRAMPAGRVRCWQPRSAMSMSSMSGALLRAQKIDLAGRKSWCESNDPEFVAKAADVVGLYMAPPENAIVICVDEKPSIQALERAQGYLKLPNGRALTGHSHDYKRNGTTTLFAAFEVATGKVTAAHKTRRRRIEFLDFMNDIVAAHADTAIHVVLDNLNTHKPRNDRWLKRHPNVHFHFTPTRASWLNQVEIWFSILEGKSLHGTSFTSVKQLREHIDAFIKAYNTNATPFAWTKSEVHQKRLKPRFAHQ